MSTSTVDQHTDAIPDDPVTDDVTDGVADQMADQMAGGVADAGVDPFELDITFIEGTPAAETVLMCGTGDTCGSSCPSACVTS